MTKAFILNPLILTCAQPRVISQSRVALSGGENIFWERSWWVRNKYLDKERRNRTTTWEGKKLSPQPNHESLPEPLVFQSIALSVKLLGQVHLRPNKESTLSFSSRKDERKIERMTGCQGPRFSYRIHSCPSPNAKPRGIPKLEKVGVMAKVFLENTLDECRIFW